MATTSGLIVLACSGDTGTRFEPGRAAELTQAALISGPDLPGGGWRIRQQDLTQDGDLAQVTDGACDDMKVFVADARQGAAAGAERSLEQPTYTTLIGVVVTVEIAAYQDSRGLAKLLRRYRRLVSEGSLARCLARTSERILAFREAKASSTAPHGGVAFADLRQFTALTGPPLMRINERYLWVDGNVAVLVTISAPRDRFSSDVVKAALEKTDAAVAAAGGAK